MTATEEHLEPAARLPKVFTGTHGPEDGAGAPTPWPDDVPPDQDDSWYPLRDDPWKARRMELVISAFWAVTALAGLGMCVVYVTGAQTQLEGLCMCAGFLSLGTGLVLWARFLLPGHDITASRGHHLSDPEVRGAVVASLSRGTDAMMSRRGFLAKKVLVPVGGIFGLGILFPIASLGPRPNSSLYKSKWYAGARLVTEDGTPLTVDSVEVDGLLTVFPEGYVDDVLSATVILNIGRASLKARKGQAGFEVVSGENGLVAFSKICTHAGCAVSLFNVLSMQLVCPCHQSTFNILEDAAPVFGPASRPLPQLPLGVRSDGYLIAVSDYVEPVGPGFWDRPQVKM